MRRFIKREELKTTSDDKVVKVNVADPKIHLGYKRMDRGFASEILKGTTNLKPSEKQLMDFQMECRTCLIELPKKMLEKCPVSYSLVRHLACLNPVMMVTKKEVCLSNSRRF